MTLTRADSFTSLKKQQEYFSDFLNSFAKTPVGEQLGRVTNEQAVNQSLKNLIKTNIGERLFQPNIGGNVYASLFELNTPMLINSLEFFIEDTIKRGEPRANLISVKVESLVKNSKVVQLAQDSNSIVVTIIYNLINNPKQIVLETVLKRIR